MDARRISTLHVALGLSLAFHAALLTVRFIDPEAVRRAFRDTPLEVILVNSRTSERPDQPKAIAQANLAGGGPAERGRAQSPLPPTELTAQGSSTEQAQRSIRALQTQQTALLAQLHRQLAELPPPDPRKPADAPENVAREQRMRMATQQIAEIERRLSDSNEQPRRRYVSPATREEAYALYYDRLRRRIEDRGTRFFPEANGTKLYGDLTILMAVDANGALLRSELLEGSGNPQLDRQALALARTAGPFGPFSAEMRRTSDEIVVVSRFRFTRDVGPQTQFSTR